MKGHPRHLYAVTLVTLALGLAARADLPWETDESAGVRAAQKQQRPICFWLCSDIDCNEREERNNVDRDRENIRKALRDAGVERAAAPFVLISVNPGVGRKVKQQLKGKPLELIITSEDGTELARLPRREAADVAKLRAFFRGGLAAYRRVVYERELLPVLESGTTRPDALRKALAGVKKLGEPSADAAVIAVLARSELDARTQGLCFETLAELSTKDAVAELLRWSGRHEMAAKSLRRLKPSAAPLLVEHVQDAAAPEFVHAYGAAAHLAKLSGPKSAAWWTTANPAARDAEIARLKARVAEVADAP